jgi:(E)-4-hydroxy-3-methylbut-2-enyl-diphosphate synthase
MIFVGNLPFDGCKIYVQSMLNVIASDVPGNVRQARELAAAGADIIRVSVPSLSDVGLITALKNAVNIPVVADVHFSADIAVQCAVAGADKIRINPGNIGDERDIRRVADACKARGIPIRIGVNSGSVPKNILAKYSGTDDAEHGNHGTATVDALVETALENVRALEQCNFTDIIISVKSSDVRCCVAANRKLAALTRYPLHLGVTEAGTYHTGLIKSAAGIGALLLDGIGATIRVSLSDEPVNEIRAGRDILKALNLAPGVKVIACPTCGRTKIDVIGIAKRVEELTAGIKKDLTVAVMGCIVNGPGEARGADIAITGGDGVAMLYRGGEQIRKINEDEIIAVLLEEIENAKQTVVI